MTSSDRHIDSATLPPNRDQALALADFKKVIGISNGYDAHRNRCALHASIRTHCRLWSFARRETFGKRPLAACELIGARNAFHLRSLTGMRERALAILLAVGCSVPAAGPVFGEERWLVHTDARGTRVEYPGDVFSVRQAGEAGGRVLTTADGRARLEMYAIDNLERLSPSAFVRKHFPTARSVPTYDRVARNFFAVSTIREGMILYVRCNFSAAQGGTRSTASISDIPRIKSALGTIS